LKGAHHPKKRLSGYFATCWPGSWIDSDSPIILGIGISRELGCHGIPLGEELFHDFLRTKIVFVSDPKSAAKRFDASKDHSDR